MAGTIPLSMTQQFTSQGVPLAGGKLYIFQTATTTPQNAYSDSGLTTALANPITLDSSGRIPQFFLADGTIKVRLTDKAGGVQAEWDNLLVIGPSGGGGGGGSTVDPTTIFQTGMCIWLDQTGVLSGFVRDNARTIGSATSGATERANSDTQSLFTFLWNTYSDTICPVIGGRGATAAADWSANKQITLPDKRGRAAFGVDDMGNTSAGRLANGGLFISGSNISAGSVGGADVCTLTAPQIPVITPTGTVGLSNNTGIPIGCTGLGTAGPGGESGVPIGAGGLGSLTSSFTGDAFGGGGAHNNLPPFVLGTFYRKL